MKELVEHIARALVDHPDDVRVDVINQGGQTIIELRVHEEDMGRVIGKDGKVANALRMLLRMMAAREGQRVQLEIV
ncbi:MAG TPA: KH domain-containing protein [Anaerolineales bacterium]|nr:KH domain-containing protein [Anaerolineales bacterium]